MSESNQRGMLREEDECMLMRFVDGQSGFFERRAAKALIERNSEAASFVNGLRGVSKLVQGSAGRLPQVDLWDRVSQRIKQEEHAALFLGERIKDEPAGIWAHFMKRLSTPWSVAVSGSLALASVGALVLNIGRTTALPLGAIAANQPSAAENVQTVALHGRPQLLEDDRSPNVVEVDWMRSDGRVRILHDPSERAPMIWVKRRANRVAAPAQFRSLAELALMKQPTPTFHAMSPIGATE